MKRKIYLRADGNSTIGLGHVIRSAALAKILKDDFDCHFVIRNPMQALTEEITLAGARVLELEEEVTYEEEAHIFSRLLTSEDIVVLDGYNFGTNYQQALTSRRCKLVCVDDIHAYPFLADVIINHAGGITPADYHARPNTAFCLGPAYALLRTPFLTAAKNRTINAGKTDALLICMGGADPQNDTLTMLSMALKRSDSYQFYVVVGAGYRHTKELEAFISDTKQPVHLFKGLGPADMCEVMSKCSTAICPPSSIAMEYMSVGGVLYLHEIADNQKDIRKYFIEEGLAFDVAQFGQIGTEQMKKAFNLQHDIFDGRSDRRLLDIFYKI